MLGSLRELDANARRKLAVGSRQWARDLRCMLEPSAPLAPRPPRLRVIKSHCIALRGARHLCNAMQCDATRFNDSRTFAAIRGHSSDR
jgi:hypothetical protein